jgi:Holliday junction resolvase RusA-like endonuclease
MFTKKILELIDITMPSINAKFNINRKTGRLFASKEYTHFKTDVARCTLKPPKFDCLKPFSFDIHLWTSKDIDAVIKPLLDGMCVKLDFDDKHINCLHIFKNLIKRGKPETVRVFLNYGG